MGKIDSKANLIRLMEQYKNLVFSICLKLTGDYFTAEDITQETFLAAYTHFDKFDGANEKAWICRIASNKCLDFLKKRENSNVKMATADMEDMAVDTISDPLKKHINNETLRMFAAQCGKLPEKYSKTAEMYFIEGLSAAEIAAKSGENLKTVQSRIYRAREMLRKTVRKEDLLQ